MAGSSRSKRKPKLEPISLEELAGTTGMSGFCSFLTKPASVYAGEGEAHTLSETPTPCESPALSETPTQGAINRIGDSPTLSDTPQEAIAQATAAVPVRAPEPNRIGSESPRVSESTRQSESPRESESLRESEPGWVPFVAPRSKEPKIRPIRLAQDGHSLGEQAVYAALWAEAGPQTPDTRVISIGYERLANASRLHWTNVKKNLRALEAKLAIETIAGENSNERIGKTYRVYSYAAILERRRAAGYFWYRKSRGVELLKSPTLSDSPTLIDPNTERFARTAPVREPHRETVSDPHTPLGKDLGNSLEETSSSAPAVIVETLRRYGPADDDGVRRLADRCRQQAPDATDEEIAHFIDLKLHSTRIHTNVLGFLLTALPRCFEGESFRQFRQEQARAREAEARRTQETARDLLADPSTPEDLRRWAKDILG